MKRNSFIKNVALGATGTYLLPSFLSSCKDKDIGKVNWNGKVIIIGAGAAGLEAAKQLKQAGIKFISILEASGRWGGRIKSLASFTDFNIELGAEEIHGENSAFKKMFDNQGKVLLDSNDGEDYIFYNGAMRSSTSLQSDNSFIKADNLITEIETYSGNEVTALQYINSEGINNTDLLAYLNAQIGNERGTTNDRIGLRSLATLENLWTAGDKNFFIKNSTIYEVLAKEYEDVLGDIKYNEIVNSINFSGSSIEVKTENNNTHVCDRIVIAVPLSVLKNNKIAFSSTLPDEKISAINTIGFDAGMKIIIKFSERFWQEDAGSIFGSGYVPEFWTTGRSRGTNNILTAFIMGSNATYLSSLGNNAIQEVLMQLDSMYGNNIATNKYQSHFIMDWLKEPHINGAYSYTTPNSETAFINLATSINSKVFFAGEATHYAGHHASVHGAIETGKRAAKEIIDTVS
jgi:monoamine oxidase